MHELLCVLSAQKTKRQTYFANAWQHWTLQKPTARTPSRKLCTASKSILPLIPFNTSMFIDCECRTDGASLHLRKTNSSQFLLQHPSFIGPSNQRELCSASGMDSGQLHEPNKALAWPWLSSYNHYERSILWSGNWFFFFSIVTFLANWISIWMKFNAKIC